RSLGKKRNATRRETQEEHRSDECVGVIEHKDGGRCWWNVFETGDLNAAKIDSQRQSQDNDNDSADHRSNSPMSYRAMSIGGLGFGLWALGFGLWALYFELGAL